MPVTSWKEKAENQFRVILRYRELEVILSYMRPCLKNKTKDQKRFLGDTVIAGKVLV